MKNNEIETAVLQVGDTLVVNSMVGTASVTPGDAGTPVAVTGATLTFGPYDDVTVLTVRNISGTTDISRTRSRPSPVEQFARKYKTTVYPPRRSVVTVPAGSKLTLTGQGYVYGLGTYGPFQTVTSTLAIAKASVTQQFVVVPTTQLDVETAWADGVASPTPTPTPTPTPGPTPTPANLAQVSNAQYSTNAAQTWWSLQTYKHPTLDYAIHGNTDNTGLQYATAITPSTRATVDNRRVESPRTVTTDEHNFVAIGGNGVPIWMAVGGHNNPVSPSVASQGRLLIFYSATGKLEDLQGPFLNTMPGTTSNAGINYGQWDFSDPVNPIFWTNNDATISWRGLRFPNGDFSTPGVWERALFKNAPGDGQPQLYMLMGRIDSNTVRHYAQFHPSNTRNSIRYLDRKVDTGDVFKGATNLGSLRTGTATLHDFTTDNTAPIAYDPGAGNSCRLMDAVGAGIGLARFVAADGSNGQHVWVEGGVEYPLGATGAYFGTVFPGAYYPGLARAREPHSGYRFYRCFNDGSVSGTWTIERLDMATLGGTITRTTIETGPTPILRPFPFENATADLALSYLKGPYTSFTNFGTRMVASNGSPAAAQPSISYANPTATASESGGPVSSTINAVRNGITGDLIVNLARAGTATSGTDYTAGPTSVTILSGQDAVTFTSATIIDDVAPESNETIIETATLAAYPSVSTSKTITITDNDTAGGTLILEDNFTEASSTPLTSHTGDSGGTWSTVGTSTDFNVSAGGRTICGSSAERIVQSSVVMSTPDADAEIPAVRPTDVGNAIGVGLRCENGVKGGYYWMLNDASDLIQILRISGGTTVVVATCPYTPAATGDLPIPRIRAVGATAVLSVLLGGTAQTLTVPATAGITAGTDNKSIVDAAPLAGNRIHLRHNTQITTNTTGLGLDALRVKSF